MDSNRVSGARILALEAVVVLVAAQQCFMPRLLVELAVNVIIRNITHIVDALTLAVATIVEGFYIDPNSGTREGVRGICS